MITIVEFDFEKKVEREVTLERAKAAMAEGWRFVWVDLDTSDPDAAGRVLDELHILSEDVKQDLLTSEAQTRYNKFEDSIQLVLTACAFENGRLELRRVDVVMGKHFLLTTHAGPVRFMNEVRKHYRSDFVRFAASPGFLIYELWDHLIEDYVSVQNRFEDRVQVVQRELMGEVDDRVFSQVGALGSEILRFRNVLLPARAVLAELASRKSIFVSEATQAYLGNMVAALERVLADLIVDRDVLSDSLNLYMSMVGHRTNRIMSRLTVVSIIFLPLTFLCGVYGMNFDFLPELHWRYGYGYFWGAVVVIAAAIFGVMRRYKLV